jgi:hypothetical protein
MFLEPEPLEARARLVCPLELGSKKMGASLWKVAKTTHVIGVQVGEDDVGDIPGRVARAFELCGCGGPGIRLEPHEQTLNPALPCSLEILHLPRTDTRIDQDEVPLHLDQKHMGDEVIHRRGKKPRAKGAAIEGKDLHGKVL